MTSTCIGNSFVESKSSPSSDEDLSSSGNESDSNASKKDKKIKKTKILYFKPNQLQ